jgi:hypothetical protein
LHFNFFFSLSFFEFFEGFMRIGYMWVVRLELTSVRLMDKAEQGDKEQLSGVIMKASYGEMREGREGETCASAIDFPFDLGSPDTRKEPVVICKPKRQPWHLREIGI